MKIGRCYQSLLNQMQENNLYFIDLNSIELLTPTGMITFKIDYKRKKNTEKFLKCLFSAKVIFFNFSKKITIFYQLK